MERFTLEILICWHHALIKNTEKYDVEKVPTSYFSKNSDTNMVFRGQYL